MVRDGLTTGGGVETLDSMVSDAIVAEAYSGGKTRMLDGAYVYILRCADRSYYVGVTRDDPELRLAQHNAGSFPGYTFTRRPVALVFVEWFERITDAIESERRIKRWSRAKKEALILGDFDALRVLASRKGRRKSAM